MSESSFPSPQGGSETNCRQVGAGSQCLVSIPSRRVGDLSCEVGVCWSAAVSIPSRRVGDMPVVAPAFAREPKFPSPQGGSETQICVATRPTSLSVSIPSRRVGDHNGVENSALPQLMFPSPQGGSETQVGEPVLLVGAPFPSPQGGSETTSGSPSERGKSRSFRPLKAGRRLLTYPVRKGERSMFPSPQGGSETYLHWNSWPAIRWFPSPQGGSETRLGMSGGKS